jgi:transcription antitermination factor NusA-like protein
MKAYAMDVHKGRTSRTPFQRGTTKQKEHWNSSIQMYVAQCHHSPIMGMYTMYHSLMIILIKDLDIFEVFNKIKEFKALIREPFCKED